MGSAFYGTPLCSAGQKSQQVSGGVFLNFQLIKVGFFLRFSGGTKIRTLFIDREIRKFENPNISLCLFSLESQNSSRVGASGYLYNNYSRSGIKKKLIYAFCTQRRTLNNCTLILRVFARVCCLTFHLCILFKKHVFDFS
jgi:hypothetical protein